MGRGRRGTGLYTPPVRAEPLDAALSDAEITAGDTILRISGRDRDFIVRVIKTGERYGRDRCLVNPHSDPLIYVHDTKNIFPTGDVDERVYGQAAGGGWYLSTVLEHDADWDWSLYGGEPVWTIPAAAMGEVLDFLKRHRPQPPRSRLSPLAV
jgi:hypothetical protein